MIFLSLRVWYCSLNVLLIGVWVIHRLRTDMHSSLGLETFRREYITQCLKDWKTYMASKYANLVVKLSISIDYF